MSRTKKSARKGTGGGRPRQPGQVGEDAVAAAAAQDEAAAQDDQGSSEEESEDKGEPQAKRIKLDDGPAKQPTAGAVKHPLVDESIVQTPQLQSIIKRLIGGEKASAKSTERLQELLKGLGSRVDEAADKAAGTSNGQWTTVKDGAKLERIKKDVFGDSLLSALNTKLTEIQGARQAWVEQEAKTAVLRVTLEKYLKQHHPVASTS